MDMLIIKSLTLIEYFDVLQPLLSLDNAKEWKFLDDRLITFLNFW